MPLALQVGGPIAHSAAPPRGPMPGTDRRVDLSLPAVTARPTETSGVVCLAAVPPQSARSPAAKWCSGICVASRTMPGDGVRRLTEESPAPRRSTAQDPRGCRADLGVLRAQRGDLAGVTQWVRDGGQPPGALAISTVRPFRTTLLRPRLLRHLELQGDHLRLTLAATEHQQFERGLKGASPAKTGNCQGGGCPRR